MARPAAPSASPLEFIKAFGLRDVVLMNVVAVVGLRWITRGARVGAPSVTLWILACLAFFAPLAAALVELSSRYPDQGGLYAWTRRAFGPLHGFVCGWCLWLNNLFYFPSLLLFAAANALTVLGPAAAPLAENRLYSAAFVLAGIWCCAALNIVGLGAGRWLQSLGSISTWLPAGLLIAAGAFAFATFGSATSFAPGALVPRDDLLATISLWSAMCFAFSGFEITSFIGQEVRDPRRTIPRGILIAGVMTMVIYMLGSASVLVAVPASALDERSGIADTIEIVSGRIGLAGLGGLTGLLLAVGSIAGTNSWTAGAARVPFAAGVDRALPASFGRIHPRYRTPHVALLIQAAAATVIFLASLFLTVGGEQTSIQEAYDILVNLTILIYFVPYVYLFVALPRLRRAADGASDAAVIRVPGGRFGLYAVTISGLLATIVSLGLLFVPPEGTGHVLNYEANLIGQTLGVLTVGLGFYWWSRH